MTSLLRHMSIKLMQNLLRRKNRQRGGQQIGKGKQCFRQTLQSCLEQQALEERHKNQHLQSRGTAYPPVWLWDVGHIYGYHLWLLKRFRQRSLRSILNIYWSDYVTNVEVLLQAGITSIELGHAAENEATLGRARLQNAGSSLTQDRPLQWNLLKYSQIPPKEIPVSLPHRSSSVVSPCCWPRSLATRRSPISLLLWEQPQSCPSREA